MLMLQVLSTYCIINQKHVLIFKRKICYYGILFTIIMYSYTAYECLNIRYTIVIQC